MFKSNSSFNVLYTNNIQVTHDFYKQIGATIKQLEVDKVVVQFGDFDLHFVLDTTEPSEKYSYIAKAPGFGQGIIFYIETEDIQKTYQVISNAQAVIKTEIFDNHWGCKEFLFEDPNGFKFAVYE